MKIFKKFINKTDEGIQVGDGIILLVSLLAVTIMTIIGLTTYTNLSKRDNVSLIARQCIIKMETDGCLTEEVKNEYIDQLTKAGMYNISFDGSTDETNVVPYGGTITLKLKGDLEIKNVHFFGFRIRIHYVTTPIEIVLTSTSKC